ncbi:UNVERIFIED_CONTAM: hypothetical protein FKN15_047645 [Acipenser sinensis]
MQESDETYIRFMQQQMQADRDFRERQMEFDLEQREREMKASNALNAQFLAVLGRLGEALLSQPGFSRAEGSAGVTGQIQGLLDSGTSWDRNCIGNVLEEAMNRFAVMQRQTEERFRVWMDKLTRLDTDDETKPCSEPTEPQIQMIGQRVPPTTQSNACMQMSGSHLHSQAYVPYVVSHQNIDSESFQIPFNNSHPPTSFSENGNPASQDLDHSSI